MLLTARYVMPVTGPHIENGAILVRDGVIEDIGPATQLKMKYSDEELMPFGLAALLPGFINCHTHLEHSAMRGIINDVPYAPWKAYMLEKEQLMDEEDWKDSALLGALESISAGITTVADMTYEGFSKKAAQKCGLRGIIYREVRGMSREDVQPAFEAAKDDIVAWQEELKDTRLTVGIAPDSLYAVHPDILDLVSHYAFEHNLPLALHLAGSQEEYDFIYYGSSPFAVHKQEQGGMLENVEYPPILPMGVSPVVYVQQHDVFERPGTTCIHCTRVDKHDIDIISDAQANVVYCPQPNAKHAMGTAPIVDFLKAGLNVGLGTDSPAAADDFDLTEAMRLGLLLQRAVHSKNEFLSGKQMIEMATIGGARVLGIDDEVGSLEIGKKADIVALDLSKSHQVPTHYPNSAVVHTTTSEDVMMTMIGGDVVYTNEKGPLTVDENELNRILSRAEEMRSKLRS